MASSSFGGDDKQRYPGSIKVVFYDRQFANLGQELGSRFAQACQDLGSGLSVDPTKLAEAYGDPKIYDAQGNDIDIISVGVATCPITFVFPLHSMKHYLLVGTKGSGKSTILGRLKKSGEHDVCSLLPEAGFPVETLQLDEFTSFVSWDLTGNDRIREAWRQFYKDAIGIIMVVDSSDQYQIAASRTELTKLLSEAELRGKPLLVYSNKLDAQDSLPAKEVAARLQLPELDDRRWSIQTASASTGSGIFTGIDSMTQMLKAPERRTPGEGLAGAYCGGWGVDSVSTSSGGVSKKWIDTDLAEVIFECVHADGVNLAALAIEHRSVAFSVGEGCSSLCATVGRQHQHELFGKLVTQNERLMSISRAHLEISWERSLAVPTLKRLSGNPVSLGDRAVGVGELVSASEGMLVGFNAVDEVGPPFLVFRVRLRTRTMLKAEGAHPVVTASQKRADLHQLVTLSRPGSTQPTMAGQLECVYSAGVDLQVLPPEAKAIGVPLGQPLEVGRLRQPGFFESLLQTAPQWLCYLSRSHCRLCLSPTASEGELFSLAIQNLSANVVFVSGRPLGRDRGETMEEGGTLRFSAAIDGVETRFLEFVFRRAVVARI